MTSDSHPCDFRGFYPFTHYNISKGCARQQSKGVVGGGRRAAPRGPSQVHTHLHGCGVTSVGHTRTKGGRYSIRGHIEIEGRGQNHTGQKNHTAQNEVFSSGECMCVCVCGRRCPNSGCMQAAAVRVLQSAAPASMRQGQQRSQKGAREGMMSAFGQCAVSGMGGEGGQEGRTSK